MSSETFPPLTDFNDLAAAEGLEAVRAQVSAVLDDLPEPEPEPEPVAAAQASEWPAPILPGTRPVPELSASVLPGWRSRMRPRPRTRGSGHR